MVKGEEIKPDGYYDQSAVEKLLGISKRAIGCACKSGALRVSERGGRRFFRGDWLIAWLEGDNSNSTNERPKKSRLSHR